MFRSLKQALENDKNVEVKTFIQKFGSEFYEGNFSSRTLEDCDCMMLVGFPIASSPQQVLDAIKNAAQEQNKPLFVVLGRKTDLSRMKTLESVLPFTLTQIRGEEISAFVQISLGRRHIQHSNSVTAVHGTGFPRFTGRSPSLSQAGIGHHRINEDQQCHLQRADAACAQVEQAKIICCLGLRHLAVETSCRGSQRHGGRVPILRQ